MLASYGADAFNQIGMRETIERKKYMKENNIHPVA
jgi:hypothetical protein